MSREADIARAVALLRAGELVAVPTETVYGLAADATNAAAVAKIFAAKGRPTGHPLIAHLASVEWLSRWTRDVPALALSLGRRFWPGPLTLIVGRGEGIPTVVTGGLDTVAVRVPAHELTRAIIEGLGRPIAAPSANRFGSVSPTTAEHVRRDLGDAVAFVVDGGACSVGVESTIVDLTGDAPVIARPGGISREDIEAVVGSQVPIRSQGEIKASGTLPSHYAPRAQVVLVDRAMLVDEANRLAARGRRVGVLLPDELRDGVDAAVVVASFSDVAEVAAQQLYAALRALDDRDCEVIVAALPPEVGLGAAIADRLRRAAYDDTRGD